MEIEYDDTGTSSYAHDRQCNNDESPHGNVGDGSARAFRSFVGRFSEILESNSESRAMMRNVANLLLGYFGANGYSAHLFNDDEMVTVVSTGLRPEFARELEQLGLAAWIKTFLAPDARLVVTDTGSAAPLSSPLHRTARAQGIETVVAIPLKHGDDLVGALLLYWLETHRLSLADRGELGSLARLTALALANARMIETRKWERTAQDQFLSMLSHELRTPLTSIMGFTQIIRRRVNINREIDGKMRDQLDLLWAQSQRLNRLLDTFVDITNIERGDFVLSADLLDVTLVLRSAIEQSHAQSHKGHNLRLDIPDSPIFLLGDAKRLEHMFGHLLSNAFRYSPEKRPVRVSCRALPDEHNVAIRITDEGPGIDSDLKREIFKRFYPSVTRKAGGLGVGLYVSRAIAEAHGGTLEIDSAPGEGTTVTVHLPTA